MMIKLLLVCTIAAMAAIVTEADPTGTHVSNCKSMLPGHPGTHPLAGIAAPYDIFVIGDAHLPATGPRTLHVVLSARTKKYPIHGFMLQARVSPSDGKEEAIGEFLLKPNDLVAHTVDCPPGVRNAVTHTNAPLNANQRLEFVWKAPEHFKGRIAFRGTFTPLYDHYWVGVKSRPVIID